MSKTCSYFPITIAYGFYKYFNAKSVLDISSGWGDRLIAACIADIIYYGADPNSCNTPYYEQMIEIFGTKNKQQVIKSGFENLNITSIYDLIFSSPPFFELEKYSEDKEQSHLLYNTKHSWINDFLYVCIEKAWKYLKHGGHMCLYMNDYYKLLYCENMVSYCIKHLQNVKYLGVIAIIMTYDKKEGVVESNTWMPLWIFKKE